MNKIIAALLLSVISLSQIQASTLSDYIDEIPGIGLISDEINFDGIKLKNLKFDEDSIEKEEGTKVGEKFAILCPEQEISVFVDYEIDADVLENGKLHHFIYGLYPSGPQGCLLHTLGILDSEGTTVFTLKAPESKGVYQLRFCHAIGYYTFEQAKEEWWRGENAGSKTIMGIIIVK